METLRIALIGKTGAGKSALGNTLLGEEKFKSEIAAESVTIRCEKQECTLASGRIIKVVDTPGIMDTRGINITGEITKAIAELSPGPHAILIVLQPGRATEEEKYVIQELRGLFGDTDFLNHTIIVMNRKGEITEGNKPLDIHDFINRKTTEDVKSLYRQCGKRIIAVENRYSTESEKKQYTQNIVDEIVRMGGFYSHEFFQVIAENKRKDETIAELQTKIDKIAEEQKLKFCTLL